MRGKTAAEALTLFQAAVDAGPDALAAFMIQLTTAPPKHRFYGCYRNGGLPRNGMRNAPGPNDWQPASNRRSRRASGQVRTTWYGWSPKCGPGKPARPRGFAPPRPKTPKDDGSVPWAPTAVTS